MPRSYAKLTRRLTMRQLIELKQISTQFTQGVKNVLARLVGSIKIQQISLRGFFQAMLELFSKILHGIKVLLLGMLGLMRQIQEVLWELLKATYRKMSLLMSAICSVKQISRLTAVKLKSKPLKNKSQTYKKGTTSSSATATDTQGLVVRKKRGRPRKAKT